MSRQGLDKALSGHSTNHTDVPICKLLAYAKAVSADLGPKQKQQVRKLTMLLKEQHGMKGD